MQEFVREIAGRTGMPEDFARGFLKEFLTAIADTLGREGTREVALPRQKVGDVDVEGRSVPNPGGRDQQPLGSSWPEPLDQPEDL